MLQLQNMCMDEGWAWYAGQPVASQTYRSLLLASALTGTSGKSVKHGQASWMCSICCNVLDMAIHLMFSDQSDGGC